VNGLEFTRSHLAVWLIALPFAWMVLYWLVAGGQAALRRYGAAPSDPLPRPFWRALRTTVLLALGLVCWLDPRYGEEPELLERRGVDLLFCLDTSRSMLARDVEPDRLARAVRDIRAVLPRLVGGDRVGLVVFAGQARLWVPLTHDLDSFRALLDEVDTDSVPKGGTDLAAALRRCGELAEPDHAATTVVLLLTDGEDLAGAGREAARELAEQSIVVHTVGYGSALGSKITFATAGKEEFLRDASGNEVVTRMDPESLRALAAATGGEFLRADAFALPLLELHEQRIVAAQKRSFDSEQQPRRIARYQWVLLPLLLLLVWDILTAGGRHR
jgi:Ca-activated chloride channel family protein